MDAETKPQAERFRMILEELAGSTDGWSGPAGAAFAALIGEALERKADWIRSEVGESGVMVSPDDVVSEAVLVVSGSEGALVDNVQRILAMERPLGYVISAVSANLSRAVLSEHMGVGSRQVSSGSRRVLHLDELADRTGREVLERIEGQPAWLRERTEGSREARAVQATFVGVLAHRFRVRASAVWAALEVAGTVAVEGDTGAGLTPATTRRRLSRFMREAPSLRGFLDRPQAQAMAFLLFGSERHPDWSLLAECARALDEGVAVQVSAWQARHARVAAARGGRAAGTSGRQEALFAAPVAARQVMHRSA